MDATDFVRQPRWVTYQELLPVIAKALERQASLAKAVTILNEFSLKFRGVLMALKEPDDPGVQSNLWTATSVESFRKLIRLKHDRLAEIPFADMKKVFSFT
jgi:hypothetical protein